jgi:CubicO group peptidase (beta-lactamase class C family)
MLALGIASLILAQGQAKPIPKIDFSNLPYQQQVKQMADGWRSKYNLPGVWCAFVKDGKVVACVASGYRNLEKQESASISDHVSIGSVSKPISGTFIALHVTRGELKYETTVGEVFAQEAKEHPSNPLFRATLRQLLTHTSGLPGWVPFFWSKMTSRGEQLAKLFAYDKINNPGERTEYSNSGFLVAVAMAEKVSGTKLEDWLSGRDGNALGLSDVSKVGALDAEVKAYTMNADESVVRSKEDVVENNAHHPAGTYCLNLQSVCGFALATMNGYPGAMKSEVFQQVTHFPPNLPSEGLVGGKLTSSPIKHTSAGWGGNEAGYLFHDGNAGHGYCNFWINVSSKRAFFFYTNLNGVAPNDPIPGFKSIAEDIKRLRFSN